MDSEHRHELAENDLARILKQFGSRFEGYGGPIVAGLIAICAVVIGVAVVRGQAEATAKDAWKKLGAATIPENFASVADEYPDTEIAAWAKVNEGRLHLREGIREAFQDKESSQTSMAAAKAAFDDALANPDAPSEVRGSATFGLATYEEAVSSGDTKAAIAAYQRYVDEFPGGASRQYAEHRIEVLQSDAAQEFYAWFSEQEPKRESVLGPNDGLGGLGGLDAAFPPAGGDLSSDDPFQSLKPDESDEADSSEDASPEAEQKMDDEAGEKAADAPDAGATDATPESAGASTESAPAVPESEKVNTPEASPEDSSASDEPAADAPASE